MNKLKVKPTMENSQTELCPYCGDEESDHDFQHLARYCYPRRIEDLKKELSRYKKAWEDLRDSSEGKIHEYAVAALEGKDMKQWLKEKK